MFPHCLSGSWTHSFISENNTSGKSESLKLCHNYFAPCLQLAHRIGIYAREWAHHRYSLCNMALFSYRCIWLNSVMACTVTMLLQASTVELCQCVDNKWFVKLPFCPSALERTGQLFLFYFFLVFAQFSRPSLVVDFVFFFNFFDFVSSTPESERETCICLPHSHVKPSTRVYHFTVDLIQLGAVLIFYTFLPQRFDLLTVFGRCWQRPLTHGLVNKRTHNMLACLVGCVFLYFLFSYKWTYSLPSSFHAGSVWVSKLQYHNKNIPH